MQRRLLIRAGCKRQKSLRRFRTDRPSRKYHGHAETAAVHARSAGLRYLSDRRRGIRRVRAGKGFHYVSATGRTLHDRRLLKRIHALVIPPAWEEVWICPDPHGHLQATGRDNRGRKQYRYHPRWRVVRDETKFSRMIAFGRELPKIRRRIERDLRCRHLNRNTVLAAVVHLLDLGSVRVGNEEYADQNKSYGLTTFRDRHVEVKGSRIHLRFRGKSGKQHAISITHPILSRIVKRCQDLPGQQLFQYVAEDDTPRSVSSSDVNDYLSEITGKNFTSKDFRTWTGTVFAADELNALGKAETPGKTTRHIIRAIECVAARLGNTPAVCKKCYIHPIVLDTYSDGRLIALLRGPILRSTGKSLNRLSRRERSVLQLLLKTAGETESARLKTNLRRSLKNAKTRRNPAR